MTTTTEVDSKAVALLSQATALVITNRQECEAASGLLRDVRAIRAEIENTFKPIKRAQDEAKRETLAQERRHLEPVEQAEEAIRAKTTKFLSDERRKQEEAARAAREAAERVAREQREAQARELESRGDVVGADVMREAPIEAPQVTVAPPPRVPGVSIRETWSAEVTDFAALCRHQAEHPEKQLCTPNMPGLNQLARLNKAGLAIPGVKALCIEGTTSRG